MKKCILFIIIILNFISSAMCNENNYLDDYNKGVKYFENKDFNSAEPYLVSALNLNSRLTFANIMLGIIEISNKNYDKGLEHFYKFINNPADKNYLPVVYKLILDIFIKQKKWEEALNKLEQLYLDKSDFDYIYYKGTILLNIVEEKDKTNVSDLDLKNKCIQAKDLLESLLDKNYSNIWLNNNLGRIYILLGWYQKENYEELLKKSIQYFTKAKTENSSIITTLNLSISYRLLADYFKYTGWINLSSNQSRDEIRACKNFNLANENYINAIKVLENLKMPNDNRIKKLLTSFNFNKKQLINNNVIIELDCLKK